MFGNEGIVACEGVREEEAGGQRVRFVGIDGVERYDDQAEDEGKEPRMTDAETFSFREIAACCFSFGAADGFI
jgi:hypothetical protein